MSEVYRITVDGRTWHRGARVEVLQSYPWADMDVLLIHVTFEYHDAYWAVGKFEVEDGWGGRRVRGVRMGLISEIFQTFGVAESEYALIIDRGWCHQPHMWWPVEPVDA